MTGRLSLPHAVIPITVWLLIALFAGVVRAQITFPTITYSTTVPPSQVVVPAGSAFDATAHLHRLQEVPSLAASVPNDSIRSAVLARATAWLTYLQASSTKGVSGIQLDQDGRVAVMANQDSVARIQIAQRLATPNLPAVDKGYTLLVAVRAFADTSHRERLAIAEEYLTQLDRLPIDVGGMWAYLGHAALIESYTALGQREQVIAHGTKAFALLSRLPYSDRGGVYNNPSVYLMVLDALIEVPGGKARIDTITRIVQAAATPTAAQVAVDSALLAVDRDRTASIRPFVGISRLLGTTATTIRTTALWNTADTSVRDISLNDGAVHVVLFGTYSCCVAAIRAIQRIQAHFPTGVKTLYATATRGYWGSRIISPAEERTILKERYAQLNATLPIALWVGEKQPTRDGGSLPTPSPNLVGFSVPQSWGYQQKPYVVIVDGTGIIRQAYFGFDRGEEANAVAFVTTLLSHH